MPRLFRVSDGPPLMVKGVTSGMTPLQRNAPVIVRRGLAGITNNMPGPNGEPGSQIYPYNEAGLWGDGAVGGQLPPAAPGAPDPLAPSPVGTPTPPMTPAQYQATSSGYGQSARDWTNPCTYAGFPLSSATPGLVITGNLKRNSLIIQNTATATSPDIAPNLYIGFNIFPAQNNGALMLAPGLGFFWGASDPPPRDAIYCIFLNGSGGSQVFQGSVIQGSYIPA